MFKTGHLGKHRVIALFLAIFIVAGFVADAMPARKAYAAGVSVAGWVWDDGSTSDKTLSFTNETTASVSALLMLQGLSTDMHFTVPKYLYNYRDGSNGPALKISALADYFTYMDNGATYTLTPKAADPTATATYYFTYTVDLAKTRSGQTANMYIDYAEGSGSPSRKALKFTVNTKVMGINVTKKDTGIISGDDGQHLEWNNNLNTIYGLSQSQFNSDMNANSGSSSTKIRYEEFRITSTVTGSQAYSLKVSESPMSGGTVVGLVYWDTNSRSYVRVSPSGGVYTINGPFGYGSGNSAPSIYVLVRYSVSKSTSHLSNTVTVTATGVDSGVSDNSHSGTATSSHRWEDPDVSYSGDVWGLEKWHWNSNSTAGLNILRNGGEKELHYQLRGFMYTSNYLKSNGAYDKSIFNSYINASVKPTYRMELVEDSMFIWAHNTSNYNRLNDDDYTFDSGTISVNSRKTIDGTWNDMTNKPNFVNNAKGGTFTVYYMKNRYSSWQVLSTCDHVEYTGQSSIPFIIPGGAYRMKVVYEDVELSETVVYVSFYMTLKGTGSFFTSNRDSFTSGSTYTSTYNAAAIHGYQNNNASISLGRISGKDSWQNPVSSDCYSSGIRSSLVSADTSIYPDHGQYGYVGLPHNGQAGELATWSMGAQYSQRAIVSERLDWMDIQAGAAKWHNNIRGVDNSMTPDGKVSYNLVAMYGMGHSQTDEQARRNVELGVIPGSKKAVFYDLLPKGLEYESISEMSGYYSVNTNNNGEYNWQIVGSPASGNTWPSVSELKSVSSLDRYSSADVQVTDNYNGTGRQLLKITLSYDNYPISCTVLSGGNAGGIDMMNFACTVRTRLSDPDAGFANSWGYTNYFAAQFISDRTGKPIEIDHPSVHSDDGSYFPGFQSEFRDLDGDGNTSRKTVVAAKAFNEGILTPSSATVSKRVKADGADAEWKAGITLDLGSKYTYKLTYDLHNGDATEVVLYDVLEGAYGSNGHWQGKFDYIDVSEAVSYLGITPTVYYNPNAVTGNVTMGDLTAANGWTRVNLSGNKWYAGSTRVGSIAVSFGSFRFKAAEDKNSKTTAAVYLHMTATEDTKSAARQEKAYNVVCYSNKQTNVVLNGQSPVCTVSLNIPPYMHIQVSKSGPAGRDPEGAVYTVYKTNSGGALSNPIGTLTIGSNGKSNVLQLDIASIPSGKVYVKETKAPTKDASSDFAWLMDESIHTVELDSSYTEDAPLVINSTDTCRTLYSYVRVRKLVTSDSDESLTATYSPAGAIYGVYSDSACTSLMTQLVVGNNGYSDKFKVSWASGLTGKTVYIKEISAPIANSTSHVWNKDSKVYTVELSCDSYIPKDADVPVKTATSTDTVTEYTYVKIHKTVPEGRNPEGAVYTAYKDSACRNAVGTFTVGKNGYSNVLQFSVSGVGVNKIYIKETKVPTKDVSSDFVWLIDSNTYTADLKLVCTEDNPVIIDSADGCRTLYGYVQAHKLVASDSSSGLTATYSPAGAIYGVYSDSACRNIISQLVIGNNGYSDKLKLNWSSDQTGRAVYVKEISVPANSSSSYKWNKDPKAYTVELSCDGYIAKDANVPVGVASSTDTVTEYTHVKIRKTAPSGRNPEGAVYTAYKDSACKNAVGTFTIGADGNSNTVRFSVSGIGASKIYIKETGLPNVDTSGDFVWLADSKTYTADLKSVCDADHPVVINSSDNVRTLYGYVRVRKLVEADHDKGLTKSYSPVGAVYGVYGDSACKNLISQLVINADGYSDKLKIGWTSDQTGKTVYVKEISTPVVSSTSYGWNKDPQTYTISLSCDSYIKNDADVPVETATSTDTVVEYTHVKIHKTVPAKRNPQGAVYTAYKNNNNGVISNEVGTFTVGADGNSNVIRFNISSLGVSRIYVKETKAPMKDVSPDFVWLMDNKTYTVDLKSVCDAGNPVVIESADDARTLYSYIQAHKLVGADHSQGLTGTYSPAGAVYGVYSDSGCTDLMTQLVIGENGYSDRFKVNWPSNLMGKTVYVKEISAPVAGSSSHLWNIDPKVYTVELSCDGYIPDDADVPVEVAVSLDTVTEYSYVKIHKNAPKGRNPQGAVYTAYKTNNNGNLSDPVGTFTIGANGYSNTIRFSMSGVGTDKLYVRETGLPDVDVSPDFVWLADSRIYTINLRLVCTEDNPVVIDSTDTCRTLYGYVQLNKEVVPATGNPFIGYYSPEGAVYGVYDDAACSRLVTKLTVRNDGYTDKLKLSWPSTQTGRTVYVKEISTPKNLSTAYKWNIDTEAHSVTLSCNEYIKDDANVAVKTVNSTNTVTEYVHAQVHKDVPEKRSPKGAVYKAYKHNSDGVLSGEIGTFAVGADGYSNILRFDATGLGVDRIYVKEASVPNADVSPDFVWLIDDNVYEIELNFTCGEDKPYLVRSKDECRTLYGYVQVNKSVNSVSGSVLNEAYSPAGAVYGVYGDITCRNELSRLTIGTDGYSDKYKVSWNSDQTNKTVYVKEISAPAETSNSYEWRLDTKTYVVNVSCDGYIADDHDVPVEIVGSKNTVQEYTFCSIRKETDHFKGYLEIVSGNPLYSLEGAEFVIETAYPSRVEVGRYVTGANGLTETIRLEPGTYYVTETKAPKGYRLPAEPTRQVTVTYGSFSDSPYLIAFEDIPVTDPVQIWIDKEWAS